MEALGAVPYGVSSMAESRILERRSVLKGRVFDIGVERVDTGANAEVMQRFDMVRSQRQGRSIFCLRFFELPGDPQRIGKL